MKLSKFVKRAKSESYCMVIHADDSGIWLGTRSALYNATELPEMEGKEQVGAVLDITRCEYLDVDHGSVESLVRYISKNKRCARSWRQSRGLEKPKTPPPNDTKWSRKKLDEASTLYIDDVAYWERKYPGYTMNRVETRVSNAGWRHTTVIMRRAECWHGTPGRKVTPRMNR